MFVFFQFFFVVSMIYFNSLRLMPVLIILEFLGLIFFSSFIIYLKGSGYNSFMLLFFLIVAVGESVLGLLLFILFTRMSGKDYILKTTVLKF